MTTTSPDNKPRLATNLFRLVGKMVSPLLLLAGAALLVLGVSMWSTAAAMVLAGVLLLVTGVLSLERGTPAAGERRR